MNFPVQLCDIAQVANFPVQPYDIFMLGVLFFCILYGAWRGLAWEVTSVASIVLSVLVAAHFSGPLAPYLSGEAPWNRFLAMLVLYAVTSLGIWLAFRMVADFINRVQLKEFDRQLGALAGAAKGVLWCIVITFFTVTLSEPARQTILRSRSGYYIAVATHRAMPILPRELRDVLGKYIEELDEKLDPKATAAVWAGASDATG
jgi:membrane protein required for colicin V production